MKPDALHYLCLLLCLVLLGGCGGCGDDADEADNADTATTTMTDTDPDADDPDIDPNDPAAALQQAQQAMQDAFGAGQGDNAVKQAVDFRKLKDAQPDEVGSLERTSHTGERQKFMGMEMSQADAKFEDGDQRLTISIVDLGTLSGLALMGYAGWLQMEVDRETDNGFERTTKYKGYPSYEKFNGDSDSGRCEVSVWVEERFIVQVEGQNVSMEVCEEGREEVDYGDLKSMRDEGRE